MDTIDKNKGHNMSFVFFGSAFLGYVFPAPVIAGV